MAATAEVKTASALPLSRLYIASAPPSRKARPLYPLVQYTDTVVGWIRKQANPISKHRPAPIHPLCSLEKREGKRERTKTRMTGELPNRHSEMRTDAPRDPSKRTSALIGLLGQQKAWLAFLGG